jgi:hypothetical protein
MDQQTPNSCSYASYIHVTKKLIFTRHETLRKTSFCTKGYAEIHIQRTLLDKKIGIGEILGMKIQMVDTCFDASSTHGIQKLNKKPKVQFWVVFQSFSN